MKKTVQLLAFLLISIKVFSQKPIAWYQFSDGTFINAYGGNNFTKSGNNATIQDGRDQISLESIDLNTDLLSASTPTSSDSSARNMTISFWVKNNGFDPNNYKVLLNSVNTINHPLFFNNTNTALAQQNTGYMVRAVAGGVQVKALHKDQFNNIMFAHTFTSGNLNDGNWHHIAIRLIVENKAVSNPSFREVNLLTILDVDGNSSHNRSSVQRISRSDADAVNPFYQSGDFTIGGISTSNTNDKYNGEIDDLVIFDKTLANAEIAELNTPKRNLYISSIGNGNITLFPNANTSKYINGLEVELTAQPFSNYGFTNWSGNVDSASINTNPLTMIMDAEKNITANFSSTASISDINKIDFAFYPNPSKNQIFIEIDATIKKGEIYTVSGKKLMTFKSKKININQLSTGIYLLKLTTETGKIGIKKMIKN